MRSNRLDATEIMAHLFATTDLERSYRINLNVIGNDGRPQVKNLHQLLSEWLEFRILMVRRRLAYRLELIIRRLQILEGLLIAHRNIEEILHIIRFEEQPRYLLMELFQLTELQIDAILELKLRQLARLEELKILKEKTELSEERERLQQLLNDDTSLKELIGQEIRADAAKYGDNRRTPIMNDNVTPAKALDDNSLNNIELLTVILSAHGWIRAAKGHELDPATLNYKSGDTFLCAARGSSNQMAIFLDSTGRSYALPANSLPSARGQGEPLSSRLTPPDKATFISVMIGEPENEIILGSNAGYGFIATFDDLITRNRSGKSVITVPDGANVLTPLQLNVPDLKIAVVTNLGYLLIFQTAELPRLARGKGVKLININDADADGKKNEYLVGWQLINADDKLIFHAGKQRPLVLTHQELEHFSGRRAQRGFKLPRAYQRVEVMVVAAKN